MSTSSVTPVFDPQGNVRNIPADQVQAALSAGGKLAVQMKDPSGTARYVPQDMVDAATKAGGSVINAAPQTTVQKLQDLISAQNPAQNKANFVNAAGNFGKAAGVAMIPGAAGEAVAGALGGGALGLAGNAATQAATSGGLTKLAGGSNTAAGANAALAGASPVVGAVLKAATGTGAAQAMYQSALKPSTTLPAERVERLVNTGLTQGIPISKGGVEKIADLLDDVNTKIADTIAARPGSTIDPNAVAQRTSQLNPTFTNQVNAGQDLAALEKSKQQFLTEQGAKPAVAAKPTGLLDAQGKPIMNAGTPATPAPPMSALKAQLMKQGTYTQLGSKSYGELQTASQEAQKALARGIKEELVTQFPELKDLNAVDSKLLDLQPVIEKAVQRIGNHQLIGIGTPAVGIGVKAVTNSNPIAAAAGAMKAVIDNPTVKSYLAIGLSRSGLSLPAATARVASLSSALAQAAVANASAQGGNQQTGSTQ